MASIVTPQPTSSPSPRDPGAPAITRGAVQWRGLVTRGASVVPGVGVALAAAAVATAFTLAVPAVSPLLGAMLLGVLVGNLTGIGVRMPQRLAPGMAVAARTLLRLGIVLLGLRLVLPDVLALGWPVLLGVIWVVGGGIAFTLLVSRALRIEPALGLRIACGFSICGAAAVAAVDAAQSRREPRHTATAVTLVVIFGSIMIVAMPALAVALHLDQRTAGAWTGASVHEVAQVVAAGAIIGGPALKVAVVVKLARVLMLAPVLAVLGWLERSAASDQTASGARRPPLVPGFVLGFLAMVALASFGVVPASVLAAAGIAQSLLLGAAMFALGVTVHWTVLRNVGGRPVLLAAVSTIIVLLLGLGTAVLA